MNQMSDEEIIKWCQNLIDMMADGATWCIPRSSTIFIVDKKEKVLTFMMGNEKEVPDTAFYFGKIGYTVHGPSKN